MAIVVQLDEESGEANGAAYLVHMLLAQQAEADHSGRFAREALRLKPVKLVLSDTGEPCSVSAVAGGLRVSSETQGSYPKSVRAESRHVLDVPKLRLAGRALIIGPVREWWFRALLGDIVRRRVVIGGLVLHYANTMRFLWLVNLETASAR